MEMEKQCILQVEPERDIVLIVLCTLMVRGVVRREEIGDEALKQSKHSSNTFPTASEFRISHCAKGFTKP